MTPARDQFRRDRRAEPQLCRAQPRQSRLDAQRRRGLAAARRGAAGHRQDARQPRARPGAGHLPAASAARPRLAGRARHDDRGGRAGARRQCHVGLGDVGGQCGDRLARARHGRRQVPPDRRQPAHHAAPQPRMAGDAGAAAARLRERALRGPRAGPAGVRRRGRGQSHAAGAGAWRAGRRDLRLRRVGRRLPGAPASRGVEGDRAAAPARSRARRSSPSSRRKRSPPAPSTTTSSRSPTSACCSRTSRPSPTRAR